MSTYKTHIDRSSIERFVLDRFGAPPSSIETVAGGEISQAFFLHTPESELVLRVNMHDDGAFLKDRFAQIHYGSDTIPIPRLLEIGELQSGIFFALSERAAGKPISSTSREDRAHLMPLLVELLTAVHATPPAGAGYGYWRADGTAKHDSWHDWLAHALRDDDTETRAASFYDPDLHRTLKDDIAGLAHYCPEERQLVHGDFGFQNLISDGQQLTGLIDWANSMYGDGLYDIAWLDFWDPRQGYKAAFGAHHTATATLPTNYDERIRCYKLLIGLGSAAFFARSRQPDKYEFARRRVSETRTTP